MLLKHIPKSLASCKFKAYLRNLINFHNSRPSTFSLHIRPGLPLRYRKLTTAELKNGSVSDGEPMLILNVSKSKVRATRKKSSVQSPVKRKKTKLKAIKQLDSDQTPDLAHQETHQDIVGLPRAETPFKIKVVKSITRRVKSRNAQPSSKTIDAKPETLGATSIRKILSDRKDYSPKISEITQLQTTPVTADLPTDWKKTLFKILNNASPTDASEKAVINFLNKALKLSNLDPVSNNQDWPQNVNEIENLDTTDLSLVPVHSGELDVPRLSYGLDRVLFNHGVYQLQDPRTRVFNFDPYLREIMPVAQFDFGALSQYITSSRDEILLEKASEEKKKYVGSTSSMTDTLSHFHFLLSNWRPIEYGSLSGTLPSKLKVYDFAAYSRAPVAIFLRYRDGSYAIDADKEYENNNVLAMFGRSMEKLLTLPSESYERYRRGNSDQLTEEERNKRESYHYTTCGDFLLRSQLDAYDPRLPGTGMFDLKTRCVISVRLDVSEYESNKTYEIRKIKGEWESYEREYYDMIRAAFLKYSMQVRMGRMDGIFVAFHNTTRIFGFQYISLEEMDFAIHGTNDLRTGDEEFKLSIGLLNKVFDRATNKFPEKTLRIFFETQKSKNGELTHMNIIAQPYEEEEVEKIQNSVNKRTETFEKKIQGIEDNESSVEEDVTEQTSNSGSESEEDDVENFSYVPRWDGMQYHSEQAMWDNISMERKLAEDIVDGEIIDEDAILEQESMSLKNSALCEKSSMEIGERITEDTVDSEIIDEDAILEQESMSLKNSALCEKGSMEICERITEDTVDSEIIDEDAILEQESMSLKNSALCEKSSMEIGERITEDTVDSEIIDEDAILEQESMSLKNSALCEKGSMEIDERMAEKDKDMIEKHDRVDNTTTAFQGEKNNSDSLETNDPSSKYKDHEESPENYLKRPFLAMKLISRSKVNGQYVERPKNLTNDDHWSVEYSLTEYDEGSPSMRVYQDLKRRRRLINTSKLDMDPNKPATSFFLRELRRYIEKGREFREQENEIESKLPTQIFGMPLSPSSDKKT